MLEGFAKCRGGECIQRSHVAGNLDSLENLIGESIGNAFSIGFDSAEYGLFASGYQKTTKLRKSAIPHTAKPRTRGSVLD